MGLIKYFTNWVHLPRNTRASLSGISYSLEKLPNSEDCESILYRHYLQDKALHCTAFGISNEKYTNHEIIISLTTYGERLHSVHLAIESIMQGSIKPNRIVLWLAEDEFHEKKIPKTLLLQQSRGLEIKYCKDLKSYNKLIPSLQEFPNDTIITIDDDVMYEYDLIERLVNAHITHPRAVCACRMHRIKLDKNGLPLSYLDWEQCINDEEPSALNFPTGVGGILYPPNCFNEEVFNSDVFMDICPKADDIWFYCMAKINSTQAFWVKTPRPSCYFFDIPITEPTLSTYNIDPIIRGNDVQFKEVYKKYNLF